MKCCSCLLIVQQLGHCLCPCMNGGSAHEVDLKSQAFRQAELVAGQGFVSIPIKICTGPLRPKRE